MRNENIPTAGTLANGLALGLAMSLILGLALTTTVPAAATTARITALGGCGDYFTDEANVQRWCAVLAEFPDLVIIESGRFDLTAGYDDHWGQARSGPGGGVHAALDRTGACGTAGLFVHGREIDADTGSLLAAGRQGSVTGIYARRFGKRLAGVRIGRVDGDVGTVEGLDRFSTRTDLGFGLRLPVGGRTVLDVAGDLRRTTQDPPASFPEDSYDTLNDLDSWNNLGLRLRAFIRLGERTALVPLAEYVRAEGPGFAIDTPYPLLTERQADLRRVGIGLNHFPDLDNFLFLSLEYLEGESSVSVAETGMATQIDEYSDTPLVSLRMAYETRVNPWLTGRASVGYDHWSLSGRTNLGQNDHIPMSMGLSVYAARVALDLALSDRRPGPLDRRLVSEDPDESSTWLTITLRYGFSP